jgi:hypothetical protein
MNDNWKNPPMEYRPVPFWVWNERQEPDDRSTIKTIQQHN